MQTHRVSVDTRRGSRYTVHSTQLQHILIILFY